MKEQTLLERANEAIDFIFDTDDVTDGEKQEIKDSFREILNKEGTEINWEEYFEKKHKWFMKLQEGSLELNDGTRKDLYFLWDRIILVKCGIFSIKPDNVYLVSNSSNLFFHASNEIEGKYLCGNPYFVSEKDAKRFAEACEAIINRMYSWPLKLYVFKLNEIKR